MAQIVMYITWCGNHSHKPRRPQVKWIRWANLSWDKSQHVTNGYNISQAKIKFLCLITNFKLLLWNTHPKTGLDLALISRVKNLLTSLCWLRHEKWLFGKDPEWLPTSMQTLLNISHTFRRTGKKRQGNGSQKQIE